MSSGRLPTFLIIGAMKAGTTSLWEYLRSHPQVFMPDVKELHFFSNPDRFARGLDWYSPHFAGAGSAAAVGEASTNYTKHPRRSGTPARIAAVIPEAKLVYVVREPISRIRSHYLHVVHGHGERRPLAVAVRDNPEYLDVSRYRMQIDRYMEHFDRSQLLVVTSESLRSERTATLGQVLEFLDVERLPPGAAPSPEAHQSTDKRLDTVVSSGARRLPGYDVVRRITPEAVKRLARRMTRTSVTRTVDASVPHDLRRELEDQLREDVAGLRSFLGPSFDGWGIA